MINTGVYYMPDADEIVIISKCAFYQDKDANPHFSIVTWQDCDAEYGGVAIPEEQFKRFVRIGEL